MITLYFHKYKNYQNCCHYYPSTFLKGGEEKGNQPGSNRRVQGKGGGGFHVRGEGGS